MNRGSPRWTCRPPADRTPRGYPTGHVDDVANDSSRVGKRNWWWWATGVACGLAVVGVATFALTSDERRLDTGDKIGSVVSALFGGVSLVVAVVALRGSRTAAGSNKASQFTSAPSDAHMLTGIWHHYHLTAANGRYEWRDLIL